MIKNWKKYLFLVTILFFVLGFFNILFAWMGFICLIAPFVFLVKNGRKTWCQQYCPRANFFGVVFRNRSITGKAAPRWLTKDIGKWILLIYFIFNMFVLTMSTIMVGSGRREPAENVRFLMRFKLPWELPQILNFNFVPDWAVHLSFRVYSMMFTVTVLGLLLAMFYRPRTWCTVCPVNTVSDMMVKKKK